MFKAGSGIVAVLGVLGSMLLHGGSSAAQQQLYADPLEKKPGQVDTLFADELVKPPVSPPKKLRPPSISFQHCAEFMQHVRVEERDYTLSDELKRSVRRFFIAECRAEDEDGPIYLVTMTDRDKRSLLVAVKMMEETRSLRIMAAAGIRWCHRPPDGKTCPPRLELKP